LNFKLTKLVAARRGFHRIRSQKCSWSELYTALREIRSLLGMNDSAKITDAAEAIAGTYVGIWIIMFTPWTSTTCEPSFQNETPEFLQMHNELSVTGTLREHKDDGPSVL